MSTLNLVKSQKTFGGMTNVYEHESSSTGTKMTVSIFLPPQVADETKKAPVLYWLSGLTCTHLNFIEKAGAQRVAAECGVILVCPTPHLAVQTFPENTIHGTLVQGRDFMLTLPAKHFPRITACTRM